MKCCDINIGMLNRKVTFERATKTRLSGGSYDYSWSALFAPWVSMKPRNGNERTHAGQLEATNLSTVLLHYTDRLLPDDRMVFNDEAYQIRSNINVEEANVWTQLIIEKGVVT